MIGFGQNESLDTLVFSDGNKVTAIVIEVGVDEVKYRFKNENNTNIIQTNTLAQIIFSSGRTQTFKGNQKLKFKEEAERKKEELKIKLENKKEKRKTKKESYNSSFEIGAIFGGSLNNNTTEVYGVPDNQKKHITSIQGLIVKYNYIPHFSINTQINYHITGWNRENNFGDMIDSQYEFIYPTGGGYITRIYNHYLSLPIAIEYSFHNKPNFIVKTGFYSAYLIKANRKINLLDIDVDDDLKTMNRFDFGGVFGIGLSYPINDKLTALFDCSAYYGITDFYNDEAFGGFEDNSKNRTYTAILGLTYNLSKN